MAMAESLRSFPSFLFFSFLFFFSSIGLLEEEDEMGSKRIVFGLYLGQLVFWFLSPLEQLQRVLYFLFGKR
jgi:hypothetical protein